MRPNRQQYTCTSCALTFTTPSDQRVHYTTDFHRYNLKRKVAGLVALSQADYDERSRMVQKQPAVKTSQLECQKCQKTFASQRTLDSHLSSKKHQQMPDPMVVAEDKDDTVMTAQLKQDSRTSKMLHDTLVRASTEQEITDLLNKKECAAIKLDVHRDCLFCTHQSESMDQNVHHMQSHSFHIPNQDELKDQEGLLQYLADQITVKNVCIWCQGKGKSFWSVEGVRGHMIDLGHCKIGLDDLDVVDDLAQFYSLSDDEDWEDSNMDIEPNHEDGVWNLPSGTVGHRSMHKYYKQRFRVQLDPVTSQELVLPSDRTGRGHDMQRRSHLEVAERKDMQRDQVRDKQRHDRVNIKTAVKSLKKTANGKYFRPQVDF